MLSSERPTMNQAMVTATSAGPRRSMLPVISATISITAMGARGDPPEHGHHAHHHERGRAVADTGGEGLEQAPHGQPAERTYHHPRPEHAARAPAANGEVRRRHAGEGERDDDIQRQVAKVGREALLHPSVTRAQHLGEPQGDEAREQRSHRWPELARKREPGGQAGDAVKGLGVQKADAPGQAPMTANQASCSGWKA